MSKYRIKTNGTKIYIQKQFIVFGFELWWYKVCEDGYSIGDYNNTKFYNCIDDAMCAIKRFCKKDSENNVWNQPCDVAYETDCKKELK